MKKYLSLILVVMIVLSSANVFAEEIDINIDTGKIVDGIKTLLGEVLAKFKDLKSSDWFTETVANLSNLGIISGYPDGTFRPQGDVTTAEYIKLLLETSGIEYDKGTNPWYEGLMDKAKQMNIITSSLYNSPNSPIKRKDVAVVLSKLIDKTPSLRKEFITERSKEFGRFKYLIYDTTKLSQEYKDSIYKLFEYQLIVGSTNEKDQVFYNPESNLTRAEVATIIERLIEPAKRLDKYAEYPNRNNVFSLGNIRDLTTIPIRVKPDTEKEKLTYIFYPLDGSTVEVPALSEKLNPNINKQVYELTKMLIDRDKRYFSEIYPSFYGEPDSRVSVSVAKNELYSINNGQIWMFILDEKTPFNVLKNYFPYGPDKSYYESSDRLSENSVISLRLGKVWLENGPDDWVDWLYADKLRVSFIALFGEKTGHEVYEYVLDEYLKYRFAGSSSSTGGKLFYKTKEIDNLHIDYITGDNSTLRFHISYIK